MLLCGIKLYEDLIRMPCGGVTPNWEEQNILEGLYGVSHLAWESLGIPQEELEEAATKHFTV